MNRLQNMISLTLFIITIIYNTLFLFLGLLTTHAYLSKFLLASSSVIILINIFTIIMKKYMVIYKKTFITAYVLSVINVIVMNLFFFWSFTAYYNETYQYYILGIFVDYLTPGYFLLFIMLFLLRFIFKIYSNRKMIKTV
mgnify:CR=1 FL=1